jgi:hypothetical protein
MKKWLAAALACGCTLASAQSFDIGRALDFGRKALDTT